jgi:branched-chain amino acid aminotransferase
LDEFDRAAPKGTGAVKVGGNYAPVMKWSEQARKEGYGMTLHLDSLTHSEIDEFSTSAFIGVYLNDAGERTLVVTDSKNVIESFTGDSCIALAKEAGWKVEKRPVCPCPFLFLSTLESR